MNMNMKDLPTDQSGRVRDQRIGRIVELVSPAEILEDLPLSPEQEDAVLTQPHRSRAHPRPRGRPPAGDRRAVQRPRRRGGARVRPAPQRKGERARRRPLHRDAGLLREAPHDHRLEGPDQRPAPGRQRRRQRRPADGARAAAARCSTWGSRSAASSWTRSPRSTSPTWSPGARSAPARPRARSIASSPLGFRCRSASRTPPTAPSRSRWTRSAPRPPGTRSPGSTTSGTPAILHTNGNADCHVILRGGRGRAQLRRRGASARPLRSSRRPACRSG